MEIIENTGYAYRKVQGLVGESSFSIVQGICCKSRDIKGRLC